MRFARLLFLFLYLEFGPANPVRLADGIFAGIMKTGRYLTMLTIPKSTHPSLFPY
jgi:hypothetical protein